VPGYSEEAAQDCPRCGRAGFWARPHKCSRPRGSDCSICGLGNWDEEGGRSHACPQKRLDEIDRLNEQASAEDDSGHHMIRGPSMRRHHESEGEA
jgi:ribosomal protein L37E